MNVKKGVSAPRKGQTCLPQTLAHVIFFPYIFHSRLYAFPSGSSDSAFKQPRREAPSCVDGWVGGWMDGWTGCDFSTLSIFLIFKYNNKQHKPDSKMCLKVASAY